MRCLELAENCMSLYRGRGEETGRPVAGPCEACCPKYGTDSSAQRQMLGFDRLMRFPGTLGICTEESRMKKTQKVVLCIVCGAA